VKEASTQSSPCPIRKGKIGSIASKDHDFHKIPPKDISSVKYHWRVQMLPEISILSHLLTENLFLTLSTHNTKVKWPCYQSTRPIYHPPFAICMPVGLCLVPVAPLLPTNTCNATHSSTNGAIPVGWSPDAWTFLRLGTLEADPAARRPQGFAGYVAAAVALLTTSCHARKRRRHSVLAWASTLGSARDTGYEGGPLQARRPQDRGARGFDGERPWRPR
jgi:hypothetical protein